MRKISLFLIIVTLAMGISYARSFKYVYHGVTFKCNEDKGAITITSFDNDADVVVIPGSINGVPVKKLNCFINGNNYLASEITIEEGIEEIAKFCFNEFRQLKKVTLPTTLSTVRSNAFRKGNNIAFYGPDNVNADLVQKYTSYPFNSGPVAKQGQEHLLAQQKADDEKEKKALKEKQRQNEELDKAIAKQQAELEKLNKEREDSEIEKKRQELLALEQATEAARKQNKEKDDKNDGNVFSKISKGVNRLLGGEDDKANENKTEVPNIVPDTKPLLAEEAPLPAAKEQNLSDVDINIPKTTKINESTFCFIIANEKYDELPTVNYAENDGTTFKKYCIDALGVPESQVFLYTNASYTTMMRALRKMESLANATEGKSKFMFYYAGHGSPSEEDQSAFIVPSDGLITVPSTCFTLADIYKRFGNMPTENVIVLLDACFSGLNRDNSGLIAARAIARKPKKETVTGNVIVLSATSEDETAMGYDEKGHGMFTYHVLKKIQQTNGKVKLRDLFQAVSQGVRRDSIIKNDKNQTPSLAISTKLKTSWEELYFLKP